MDQESLTVDFLNQQYEWIQSSRTALLDFCETIKPEDFIAENSSFGRGSIRNLLVHVANVYEYWIKNQIHQQQVSIRAFDEVVNLDGCSAYFKEIDQLVIGYISEAALTLNLDVTVNLSDKELLVTPFQVLTHLFTHEFHHKGQILSLARHLGYLPIDTDIIRL